MLLSRAAAYAYASADQTIIGRVLGKAPLGVFLFVTTLANLPIQEITSVVSRVVPGVFSALQQRRSELRNAFSF